MEKLNIYHLKLQLKTMKHLISLLVTLILVGFAVGITYISINYDHPKSCYWLLYLPLIIMMILWGIHLNNKYGRY